MSKDFAGLSSKLLANARDLLPRWLPGGRINGSEYECASIHGGHGDSFKVNVNNGKWKEFNGGEAGGDLISLYAKINGIKNGEAYDKLVSENNYFTSVNKPIRKETQTDQAQGLNLTPPPADSPGPDGLSDATDYWEYRTPTGDTHFYIARHDRKNGKTYRPWAWSSSQNKWVSKHVPAPRPLYNLDVITKNPKAPILITEGEKAADAIKHFDLPYISTTWPGGASAVNHVDWSPIKNRKVLIWPDADEAGLKAAKKIAAILYPHNKEIKIIDPPIHHDNPGWDAANAVEQGWDKDQFIKWAKEHAVVYVDKPVATVPDEIIEPDPEPPPPSDAVSALMESIEESVPYEVSPSQYALWTKLELDISKSGNPIVNMTNVVKVLENWGPLKGSIWFDEFHGTIFTTIDSDTPREWTDADDLYVFGLIQNTVGIKRMTKLAVIDAINYHAHRNIKNEPKDWLSSLTWDGVSRVHNFFHTYLGTPDSDYSRAVSKNFWVSMVARVFRPGCKSDHMVIIEGPQGAYKSSALAAIGGKWYAESNESMNSKDFFQALHGSILVEIGELDSFSKAEITTIKKVVSTATDKYRAPYDRRTKLRPRQSILVGTTNETHYLRDSTGGRRFWPISIKTIDLDGIMADREQLFAEAVALFKQGENWHEVPASAAMEQEDRREEDPWEHHVFDYIALRSSVHISDVWVHCLGGDIDRLSRMQSLRIAKILRLAGWEQKRSTKLNGKKYKLWEPTTLADAPPPPKGPSDNVKNLALLISGAESR